MTPSIVLLLACPDRPGIVSRVSGHIAGLGGNILRAEQSESTADSRFYQRIHFDTGGLDLEGFRTGFEPIAADRTLAWQILVFRRTG